MHRTQIGVPQHAGMYAERAWPLGNSDEQVWQLDIFSPLLLRGGHSCCRVQVEAKDTVQRVK